MTFDKRFARRTSILCSLFVLLIQPQRTTAIGFAVRAKGKGTAGTDPTSASTHLPRSSRKRPRPSKPNKNGALQPYKPNSQIVALPAVLLDKASDTVLGVPTLTSTLLATSAIRSIIPALKTLLESLAGKETAKTVGAALFLGASGGFWGLMAKYVTQYTTHMEKECKTPSKKLTLRMLSSMIAFVPILASKNLPQDWALSDSVPFALPKLSGGNSHHPWTRHIFPALQRLDEGLRMTHLACIGLNLVKALVLL